MRITNGKSRELLHLSLVVIITIIFSLFSLSVDFLDKFREFFPLYSTLPLNDFLSNIIFLWLVVTLGITYQRWREAVNKRRELEDIISSINTDVLIVVDRNGKIIMCNDSVQELFGYQVNEVINQKIDLLYSESHTDPLKGISTAAKLEKDGFYIEPVTGRRKNNDIIPLELVTYSRKNYADAVLLLRDITERKKAEEKLEKYKHQLEALVNKRSADLLTRNKQLQEEINVRKQSNDVLRKTKDYLDNIIESSLDPVVIVDINGCIQRVNDSFLKMLGYTKEEVIGKHTTEFSPSEEGSYASTTGRTIEITQAFIKQSKEMLAKLFEEGKVYNWERYFMRKDQKIVPVESNIVFLYDSEENMNGGVGILRDITERRKADEDSAEARNFLQNIFDTTADGIMVTDDQGCIVKINKAIENMLGYGEDELVGKYTTELGPRDEKHAKNRAIMFEQLFEKGHVKHWETEWFRKDGSLCPVEINITFLKDNEGNLYRAVAGIRDTSERKEAEESLRESDGQLRSLVQGASDAILTINSCGEIKSWNEGARVIFGYTPEEIIGRPFACLVPENYRENNKESLKRMLVAEQEKFAGKAFSFPGLRKDGREFPAEISYASYEVKEGTLITGFVRDITERHKAEQEIREARNFLENIFKTVGDGILVTSPDGYITMANDTAGLITGYSIDELIGKRSMELAPQVELHQERGKAYQKTLLEKGVVNKVDFTWERKDSSLIDVEMSVALLTNTAGTATGSVASFRDITERKRAEQEIKEAKEFLENIFRTTTDGIIVTDNEGTITVVNEATVRMLGYAKEDLLGEGAHIFKPEGEEHELLSNNYVEKLFEEITVTGYELIWLKKDGSLIDVEVNAALLKGDNGQINGAVSTIRDITERKEFEEILKKSEEKYRGLVENATDAIISIDKHGIIIDYNEKAEEIFGYSRDEALGTPAVMLMPIDERENWHESFAELSAVTKGNIPRTVREKKGLGKDGRELLLEYSIFSFEMQGEAIFSTFIRDITEKKEMEHKLLQSEKLKSLGELAGGVAHDFNNVLAAILGRVQLLKMQFKVPPGIKEKRKSMIDLIKSLEIIERASIDGAETVRRIQEFSRKRSDDRDFTEIDINELVNNALEYTSVRWRNEAETQGIKINIQKEFSPLPPTLGSASELREVFTNLINNALDAMPQGGSITIKTFKNNNQAFITIADTGVGISEDIRNRIFDPFFTTKGVQSTGLGMSISYGIISRHKGTILVDSSEGKGTAFTIHLPLSEKTTKDESVLEQSDTGNKKAKILVIEDEKEVRQLLYDILMSGNHEVEVASDGKEGLKLFQTKEFDLVFTDLGMPEISGWQVAETIKRINKAIPVAVITGWNVELEESEMKERGVNFIAHKPFEVHKILELVQEGMALRERFKAA